MLLKSREHSVLQRLNETLLKVSNLTFQLVISMAIDLSPFTYHFSTELKHEVREFEKVSLRLYKTECSLLFSSL